MLDSMSAKAKFDILNLKWVRGGKIGEHPSQYYSLANVTYQFSW